MILIINKALPQSETEIGTNSKMAPKWDSIGHLLTVHEELAGWPHAGC